MSKRPRMRTRGLLVAAFCPLVGCAGNGGAAECALAPDVSASECKTLVAMALPGELPPSHGNAVAEDPRAASLGFRIFYDSRMSSNNQVRCASCHQPESDF